MTKPEILNCYDVAAFKYLIILVLPPLNTSLKSTHFLSLAQGKRALSIRGKANTKYPILEENQTDDADARMHIIITFYKTLNFKSQILIYFRSFTHLVKFYQTYVF